MRDLEQIEADLWAVRDWPCVRVDDIYLSAMRRLAFDAFDLVARLIAAEAKLAAFREWATGDYGGAKRPIDVWPGLATVLDADTAPEPTDELCPDCGQRASAHPSYSPTLESTGPRREWVRADGTVEQVPPATAEVLPGLATPEQDR